MKAAKVYCKCGCGEEVKKGNKYIHGHNRAGLASYTSGGRWAMNYDCCIVCGTTKIKHQSNGMCLGCSRKKIYQDKKNGKFTKWSEKFDKCIDCGKTDIPHAANGRCGTCDGNYRSRLKGVPERTFGSWSWYHDKCIKCGTTERPHVKEGLCSDCYEESKRSGILIKCPVCGVKVEKLQQHLSMRSKEDDAHSKYQYELFKKYFDSDFSVKDTAEELGIERHAVTRNFITYFGEESTRERNEKVRRCNISEKAIINHNYKNMYGTIVEYESPCQGLVRLRSKLEKRYAEQLDEKGIKWLYESRSFPYLDKNNTRHTYTPDFYIMEEDRYIEVKSGNLITNNDLYKISWVRDHANIDIEIVEF